MITIMIKIPEKNKQTNNQRDDYYQTTNKSRWQGSAVQSTVFSERSDVDTFRSVPFRSVPIRLVCLFTYSA